MTLSPLKGCASNTLHCGGSQDTNNRTVESLQLYIRIISTESTVGGLPN